MINVKAKVKLKKNTKIWDRMVRNLSRKNVNEVRVGWFNSRNSEGEQLAQIASWNEEGHINGGIFEGTITPPRPFIRVNFIGKVKNTKWMEKFLPRINDVALGKLSWKRFHELLGKELVIMMKESILEFKSPGNSPVTISMKGFNDPLIDSGQMYDAIEYKISRRFK